MNFALIGAGGFVAKRHLQAMKACGVTCCSATLTLMGCWITISKCTFHCQNRSNEH